MRWARWALLWAVGCAKQPAPPVVSLEALRAGCAQGDEAACVDALLVYREGGIRDARLEEDLLEGACTAQFSWACQELGRRAHAAGEEERARGAWARACAAAPNLYNCALAQGKWPADPPPDPELPPAFASALQAAGMRFRMPARFVPIPPARCGGFAGQWGMRDEGGIMEVHYMIRPGEAPDQALKRYAELLPGLTRAPEKLTPPQGFPDPAFRLEFGADGAWMNAFQPDSGCTKAMLGATVLISRGSGAQGSGGAAVVLIWLHELQAQQIWPAAFHSLQFTAPGWPW